MNEEKKQLLLDNGVDLNDIDALKLLNGRELLNMLRSTHSLCCKLARFMNVEEIATGSCYFLPEPTDNDIKDYIRSGMAEKVARALGLNQTAFVPKPIKPVEPEEPVAIRTQSTARAARPVTYMTEVPETEAERAEAEAVQDAKEAERREKKAHVREKMEVEREVGKLQYEMNRVTADTSLSEEKKTKRL